LRKVTPGGDVGLGLFDGDGVGDLAHHLVFELGDPAQLGGHECAVGLELGGDLK